MNPYRDYSEMEMESHLSNFLVNNLSFSCIAQFCRNEKAFERKYIYREYGKSSASSVAGNAYHQALRTFFFAMKNGDHFDLVDCEKFAFDYIDTRPAYFWKLQKTTPTIESCISEAIKISNALLKNFFAEISTYIDEIEEILHIEVKCEQFIDVNGVSIPLPVKGELDLVFRSKKGKVVIVDHKSKKVLSSDEDMKLKVGKQAIIYTLLYESEFNIAVDEVWFIENKYSQNKDKNIKQLHKFDVKMDGDTRRLYEALLYESVKRVIEAVSDPDYVYVINDSDTLEDYADLCNFWMRTLIMEVEDFNVDPSKKEMIARRLKKTRDASIATINPTVIRKFKENASEFIQYDYSNKNMTTSEKIEHSLRSFGMPVQVSKRFEGYSSDTYLLSIGAGTKVSSVKNHRLDLANALDVESVRVSQDLIVHEGKSYLGIESPKKREKTLMFDASKLVDRKLPLGEDNFGNTVVWNLDNPSTPHALVCGGTGSGKSVLLKTTIENAIACGTPVIILDPKFEFGDYSGKSGVTRVVTDMLEIENTMAEIVDTMNQLVETKQTTKCLLIFDEFADAIMNARKGRELDVYEDVEVGFYKQSAIEMLAGLEPQPKTVNRKTGELKSLEENLRILAQKSRSVGIRMMVAAQRIDTKVMTGNAKNNFPVQICFRVQKAIDSIVVLDEPGAETLTGKGDGLLKSPEYADIVRFQAFYKP